MESLHSLMRSKPEHGWTLADGREHLPWPFLLAPAN